MRKRIFPALLSVALLLSLVPTAFAKPMTIVLEVIGDPNKEFVYYMKPTMATIESNESKVEKIDTTMKKCNCGFTIFSFQENWNDKWEDHYFYCDNNYVYGKITFNKITLKNGESIKIDTISPKPTIYTEQDGKYLISYSTDGKSFTNFKNDEAIRLSETMIAEIQFTSADNGTLTLKRTDPNAPAPVPPVTANPTNDTLRVDGKLIPDATIYKINGNNYFKIRDVASVFNGTKKQFSVGYDGASNSVTATIGKAYEPVGGELAGSAPSSQTATVSNDTIIINGAAAQNITVYKIAGNNYFKLRDLGNALGFEVDWDAGRGVSINTEP